MSKKIIPRSYQVLKRLVWFQRSLRIIIRACWLSLSGWLLTWSISTHFSLEFSSDLWFFVALTIFLISIVFILFRKPSLFKLTWTFDRLFGLKEQFSTGYQVIQEETSSPIQEALLSEVDQLSAFYIKRIKRKGWRLYPDLLSLIIVTALFYLVYQVEFYQPDLLEFNPSSESRKLPPLGEDPSMLNIFQMQQEKYEDPQESNYQFPTNSSGGSGGGFGDSESIQTQSNNSNKGMLEALTQGMNDLGNQLNFDAGTYELSQGLMSANLEEMASSVEKLANQLSQMSEENLQQISDILNELAEKLEESGLQETSSQMKQAATSIEEAIKSQSSKDKNNNNNPNDPNKVGAVDDEIVLAQESLDQIAKSLREISQENYSDSKKGRADGDPSTFDSGIVISNQEISSPKELTRLNSEADTLEFQSSSQPGPPISGFPKNNSSFSQQADITQSSFSVSDDYFIDYIVPYYYPWMWHNVVSKYFERD